jgi:hypothetical protein
MDEKHEITTDGSRVDSDVETLSATDVMQAVGVFAGGVGTFVSGIAATAGDFRECERTRRGRCKTYS